MRSYYLIHVAPYDDDVAPLCYYQAPAAARAIMRLLPAGSPARREYEFTTVERLADYLRETEPNTEICIDINACTVSKWDY